MRMLIQRVSSAKVDVDGKTVGQIGKGYAILLGVCHDDDEKIIDKYVNKVASLRIFEDENGKTNLSIKDVGGEILLISQFTLYADASHGNRPSFINAAPPCIAEPLYNYAVCAFEKIFGKCEKGIFGADMKVSLCNDGPFTIMLQSEK